MDMNLDKHEVLHTGRSNLRGKFTVNKLERQRFNENSGPWQTKPQLPMEKQLKLGMIKQQTHWNAVRLKGRQNLGEI